jgi:hypothetical protein
MAEEQTNPDEYTDQEYYEDFVADHPDFIKDSKLVSQRITIKEMSRLVARHSRYKPHEAEDILQALVEVMNIELDKGRDVVFGDLFSVGLYKPKPRRLYDHRLQGFKQSSARPRLRITTSQAYTTYLRYAIHAPVNYMPPTDMRKGWYSRAEFTALLEAATKQCNEEQARRDAKNKEPE